MASFQTFGFPVTRQIVRTRLEEVLGIAFQERVSGYLGEYELYRPEGYQLGETLQLLDNIDRIDDGPEEVEHADCLTLLRVSYSTRSAELAHLITTQLGGRLIRHREL